ncbi:DedA family protein [Solibacillus cecembensis]|uniref:DedA family protein n=1 Tax=Solibacillus cecembensis TaxID=459347 RepID=UPI003D08A205
MVGLAQAIHSIELFLDSMLQQYGTFIYIILFLIIFSKTAFIIFTFLPGDALVFAAAMLVALGELNGWILFGSLLVATIAGDAHNFFLGILFRKKFGVKMVSRFISTDTITKTEQLVQRRGEIVIIFSRFIPLMRTTVPFVCAYTNYSFRSFLTANSIGGFFWLVLWFGAGISLGQLEWMEENLVYALMIVMCIPFSIPIFFYIFKLIMKQRAIAKNRKSL